MSPLCRYLIALGCVIFLGINLTGGAQEQSAPEWHTLLGDSVQAAQSGHYPKAIELSHKALKATQTLPAYQRKSITAQIYSNLGTLYWEQGRYQEAEQTIQQAIALWDKGALKPDPLAQIMAYNTLGNILKDTARYTEAHSFYKKAIAETEQLGLEKTKDYPIILDNWAENYRLQKKYAEAELLYQKAIEHFEIIEGENAPSSAKAFSNWGTLKNQTGQYNEAYTLYKKALSLMEQSLPPKHPRLGLSQANVGGALINLKRFDEGKIYIERGLSILKAALPAEHPMIALQHHNLCVIYGSKKQFTQAEFHCEKAWTLSKKKLGEEHPTTKRMAKTLADLHLLMEDNPTVPSVNPKISSKPASESSWQKVSPEKWAAEIENKHYPPEEAWKKYQDLSINYFHQGQFSESQLALQRALKLAKMASVDRNLQISLISQLGTLYRAEKNYDEALKHYTAALNYYRQHPETSDSFALTSTLGNIGELYYAQKKYAEAESYFKEAIHLFEPSTPMQDSYYATLGFVYQHWDKPDQAEFMFKKSLNIFEKEPVTIPSYRFDVLTNLFHLYRAQGRYEEAIPILEKTLSAHPLNAQDRQTILGFKKQLEWEKHMENAKSHLAKESYGKAEQSTRVALTLSQQSGLNSLKEAITRTLLGLTLSKQQKWSEAQNHLEKAYAIGLKHKDTQNDLLESIQKLLNKAKQQANTTP